AARASCPPGDNTPASRQPQAFARHSTAPVPPEGGGVSRVLLGRPVFRSLPFLLLLLVLPAAAFAQARDSTAMGDSTAMDWSQVPEYRIVPGDLLDLNFGPGTEGVRDLIRTQRARPQGASAALLIGTQRVRPEGRMSVFPVGDVVAAGHTVRELEAAVVELLAAELKNPRVT